MLFRSNILSAVMHADEVNLALSEQYGEPIYHYHMHIVALPVVEKQVLWTKRCKNPELVGTVKEIVQQVSHSKKWKSPQAVDEQGKPCLLYTSIDVGERKLRKFGVERASHHNGPSKGIRIWYH